MTAKSDCWNVAGSRKVRCAPTLITIGRLKILLTNLGTSLILIFLPQIFLPSAALAGGPKFVAGTTYFNSGTAGTPLNWSQGSVNYYTDRGDLSPILPGATADAFVANAWRQWTSIPTVAVSAVRAGQLAEDVSGTNVTVNPDGSINIPADIMPAAITTPVGIVYDVDGSVTDALLGQGAGASESCFNNAAYGGVDNFGADAHFLHALVILNGNCAQSSAQLPDMEYRLVRVLGRVLGLDWSQFTIESERHYRQPQSYSHRLQRLPSHARIGFGKLRPNQPVLFR